MDKLLEQLKYYSSIAMIDVIDELAKNNVSKEEVIFYLENLAKDLKKLK